MGRKKKNSVKKWIYIEAEITSEKWKEKKGLFNMLIRKIEIHELEIKKKASGEAIKNAIEFLSTWGIMGNSFKNVKMTILENNGNVEIHTTYEGNGREFLIASVYDEKTEKFSHHS